MGGRRILQGFVHAGAIFPFVLEVSSENSDKLS